MHLFCSDKWKSGLIFVNFHNFSQVRVGVHGSSPQPNFNQAGEKEAFFSFSKTKNAHFSRSPCVCFGVWLLMNFLWFQIDVADFDTPGRAVLFTSSRGNWWVQNPAHTLNNESIKLPFTMLENFKSYIFCIPNLRKWPIRKISCITVPRPCLEWVQDSKIQRQPTSLCSEFWSEFCWF